MRYKRQHFVEIYMHGYLNYIVHFQHYVARIANQYIYLVCFNIFKQICQVYRICWNSIHKKWCSSMYWKCNLFLIANGCTWSLIVQCAKKSIAKDFRHFCYFRFVAVFIHGSTHQPKCRGGHLARFVIIKKQFVAINLERNWPRHTLL